MKTAEFTAGPWTSLRVKVCIHENLAALRQAYQDAGNVRDESVLAFCDPVGIKDDVIAELHFSQTCLSVATIGHEAIHAALFLGRYIRVDLENDTGEELMTQAQEWMLEQTIRFAQEHNLTVDLLSKPPSEEHQPSCDLSS